MHADRQASGTGQDLIGLHLFFGDDDVVDTGDTAVGTLLQLNGNTLGKGFRIDLTVPPFNQELRPFPQLARGLAGHWILDHRSALRAWSVACDAALAQSQRVSDNDVRPERDIGWV